MQVHLHPDLAARLKRGAEEYVQQSVEHYVDRNRRWELGGINPSVLRQQMGHSSAAMTALYTGEIPIEQVRAAFSSKTGNRIVVLENMENEAAA